MRKVIPTIESLRKSNWKVAVIHKTDDTERQYTQIIVTSPEQKHAEGFAFVHTEDNYDRKKGNSIALGRALKNLENNILVPYFPRTAN